MKAGLSDAFLNAVSRHCLVPEWMGLPGEGVPIHKGCKEGAPENPVFRNALLDQTLGPSVQECPWRRVGINVAAFAVDPDGKAPEVGETRPSW